MGSIIKELTSRTVENPDKLLYSFLDRKGGVKESYTYKEFDERTNSIANYLYKNYTFAKGDRIMLAFPPGLESICSFFACVKLGLIPVPVYPPTSNSFKSSIQKMSFIAEDSGASAILTDRVYYWSLKINLARIRLTDKKLKNNRVVNLPWIVSSDSNASGSPDFPELHSEILFIQYTSGSTNNPKGVMVSHDNIIYNCHGVIDHDPIGVSWLPQYHDMGLIGYYLFFAIKGGTTYGFSPLDFIQRPALWLETISKYKATATSAPNFAFAYCLSPGKISDSTYENLDLSSLNCVMNAAEPVNTEVFQKFINFYSQYGLHSDSCYAAYGLAEFTLAVSSYGREYKGFDLELLKHHKVREIEGEGTKIMSCGVPLRDTEVLIVDSKTKEELEDNSVGEIWLTGSSKSLGYWNKTQLSKEIFEAQSNTSESSWLRTGDLGFLYHGELYVCGRAKDMIIIRGVNYYPQDIEKIVEHDPLVKKGCVAAFSVDIAGEENMVIVVGVKNKSKLPDTKKLSENILKDLGVRPSTIVFTPYRSVSKTTSGKIMRYENRTRFTSDSHVLLRRVELDSYESHSVDLSSIKLFSSFGFSGNEPFSLGDAGLDSMKLVEFAQDLKSHLSKSGHNDLSAEIELKILQKISISELHSILEELDNSGLRARMKFKQAFARIHNEFEEIEREMMIKDALCEVDALKSPSSIKFQTSGPILLTGGTGFFGPFILKSILEQSEEDIYVVVRAEDKTSGLIRLRDSLEVICPSKEIVNAFEARVNVVCGDMSKPRLGMTETIWNQLSDKISTIYNNGALVNYLMDYESMRSVNSIGTIEVIRFACEKRQKILNHISTTFIFGWSVEDTLSEDDENCKMENLDFGYSQSKWVSEQILKSAMKQGLNARIFRPALISPSINGKGYNYDIAIRLLAFMIKYRVGTSAKNQISFTPADIAANNIVAISNIEDSLNKVFHVTRDTYTNLEDITNVFSLFTGDKFEILPLEDFVPEIVNRCTKDDILFPLINFLVKSEKKISKMEFKLYDNSNYKKYRDMSDLGIEDKSIEDVVYGILKFMKDRDVISIDIKDKAYVK